MFFPQTKFIEVGNLAHLQAEEAAWPLTQLC